MSKGLEAVRIVACLGLGQSLAQWQEAWIAEIESFPPGHELLATYQTTVFFFFLNTGARE